MWSGRGPPPRRTRTTGPYSRPGLGLRAEPGPFACLTPKPGTGTDARPPRPGGTPGPNGADTMSPRSPARRPGRRTRALRFEVMEPRCLLATITVNTTADADVRDTELSL